MRKHKIVCEMFGASGEVTDHYFEEQPDQDPVGIEETHDYVDTDGVHHQEIHIKSEVGAVKRKRFGVVQSSPKVSQRSVSATTLPSTPTPQATEVAAPSRSVPRVKSRFTDCGLIWERKLADLPLIQALQIEKSINDMLYEAALANLPQVQIQHQPAVIKVAIGQQHQGEEEQQHLE